MAVKLRLKPTRKKIEGRCALLMGTFWLEEGRKMATQAFRLRPIMKQGTAAGIPETWTHYPSVEDARAGAKVMYQNDRVQRVMVLSDSLGLFVEWIER